MRGSMVPAARWMALLALTLLCATIPTLAQTIKMATLVPEGSSWHRVLEEMGAEWKAASGGKVKLVLFPGGVAGDDPDVVRKMRLGVLHGGVLTATGVAEIDPSVYALGIPLAYRDADEVYAVLAKMRPRLDEALGRKGFVALAWTDGGWIRFFTRKPVARPGDLEPLKLFTWQGDPQSVEIWKAAGMKPVPLPATELATALQTGLVDALITAPQVAVLAQYFRDAPYMTELDWALLLGAIVVTKDAWARIPESQRPALIESAERAALKLRAEVRANAPRDVESMVKRGLHVVPVDEAARRAWHDIANRFYPRIRGNVVPADAFDAALKYRDDVRAARGAPEGR